MLLKNQIIPSPEISMELGSVAVGYYDDVDRNPGSPSFQILRQNLPDAIMLPLCGFLTPDLRWVHGYSGGRDAGRFRAEIAMARARARSFAHARPEASPAVVPFAPEAPAATAQLVGGSAGAAPTGGREEQVRAWARGRLDHAVLAVTALDFPRARAVLAEVKARTAGLPEEREAEKGEVAIHNLDKIARARSSSEALCVRTCARLDLRGTCWGPLFP
jgi:hypothetical protein